MFPDEVRDADDVRDVVLKRFVADPARLREKYRGLAARDRRARQRMAELEAEIAALRTAVRRSEADLIEARRRLGSAHGALDAYRVENRRLKDDLRRVRSSTSLRAGRAVLAPARAAKRLADQVRQRRGPSPSAAASSSSGVTDGGHGREVGGAKADGRSATAPPRPAPRVAAAATPSTMTTSSTSTALPATTPPPSATMPVEDLLTRFLSDGDPEDLHRVLSRLWYQHGEVRRPATLIAEHSDAVRALDDKGHRLVRQIRASARVLDEGWPVPARSSGVAYVAERDRVMYCVHSTPSFDSNGYSIRTGGVAQGLKGNGADVVVVARSGYPWDASRAAETLPRRRTVRVQDGIRYVHNPGLGVRDSALDQYLDEAADAYVREARLLRPSTIHAASALHTALPALVAARRLGVPFVYEVRGLWEVTEASTRVGWSHTDRYALQVALETQIAVEADAVLAITPQVAQVLVARGVDPARITIIPNAVDTDAVLPLPRDTAFPPTGKVRTGVPVIGFAGSMVPYEGLDVLVDAARLLRDRGREFQVVLAGSGTVEADLRSRVTELGLEDVVHFLGRLPHDEMPRLISTFDIMPCPRHSLPVTELVSPLKPLEAFAAAKAVVLSDVAPHRDLAGPEEQRALLAVAGDATSLADRLDDLLLDRERRRALGRRARLWARDERTWTRVCAAAVGAYRRAAEVAGSVRSGRELSELRFGLIADEFTTTTLRGSVQVVPLARDGWARQLKEEHLDLVLVESAWRGNGGQWTRGVGYYSAEEHADLRELVRQCRSRGIPVAFWNKEDPVHTARFMATAALCDYIFTVDADLVPTYRAAAGPHVRAVASLPFYAQPEIHNPLRGRRPFEPTAAYAGTYYGARYPERTRALGRLLAAGEEVGLAIYDRQLTEVDSPYRFPEAYQQFVRGGLSYEEVLETYTAHLAHLNVNSVIDSPTMFSRRVVEIAASGGVVVSSACRGIDETLGGAVPASDDPEELAGWLHHWSTDGEGRRREAWHQMRAVYRAHTTATALVILTRTAGLLTRAHLAPDYGLAAREVTTAHIEAVLRQSVRPGCVYVDDVAHRAEVLAPLRAAGIAVLPWDGMVTPDAPTWVGTLDADGGRTYAEDLLLCARFGAWDRIEPCTARDGGTGSDLAWTDDDREPGLEGFVRTTVVRDRGSLDDALTDPDTRRVCVALAQPSAGIDRSRRPIGRHATITKPGTLLVAGHDLKFVRDALPLFEESGVRVLVDQWASHTAHDEARSRELLAESDAVLCEWGLGNAVWYSRNLRPGQRLTVRVHSQELFTPHLRRIAHGNVQAYVFVSELVRRAAVTSHGVPADKTYVVPNMVDTTGLALPKTSDAETTIGFVGMVPQGKRLDIALDVLQAVRELDPGFRLVVRGKRPEEYPWLRQRPAEMEFYERQFARIAELNEARPGSVVLSAHGSDMADWYRSVGTVLSVSDFESFHLTIADGVASGAVPAVLLWPGADLVYPREWISASVEELAVKIVRREPAASAADVAHLDRRHVAQRLLEVVCAPTGER